MSRISLLGGGDVRADAVSDSLAPTALLVALFVALLATYLSVGSVLDTVAVLAVAVAFVVLLAVTRDTLDLPLWWTVGFAVLAAFLIAQVVLGRATTLEFALAPVAGVFVVAVAAFVLPVMVSFSTFVRAAAVIPAVMVALQRGIPGSSVGIGAVVGVGALLGVVGCLGTLSLFDHERRPVDLGLCLLGGWSTIIPLERGAIGALAVGFVLYAIDTRGSRRLAIAAVFIGTLALVAFIAGIIAAPWAWAEAFPIPLTRRQWLWRATWAAIAETPTSFFSGVGYVSAKHYIWPFVGHWMAKPHAPHNGYLLIWLRAGVVAAAVHAVLVWDTVALAVNMAIANYSLVMVSLRAVILAGTIGYALRESGVQCWTLRLVTLRRRVRHLFGQY